MASFPTLVKHDPDSHVFYDADWCDWLTARGFPVDGSTIVTVVYTVAAPATKTFEELTAAISRVGISGVPLNTNILVKATITMPEVFLSSGVVTDDFSFTLRGAPK